MPGVDFRPIRARVRGGCWINARGRPLGARPITGRENSDFPNLRPNRKLSGLANKLERQLRKVRRKIIFSTSQRIFLERNSQFSLNSMAVTHPPPCAVMSNPRPDSQLTSLYRTLLERPRQNDGSFGVIVRSGESNDPYLHF